MKVVNKFISIEAILIVFFLASRMAWNSADGVRPEKKKMYNSSELDTATVAGGCFWCVEAPYEKVPGVVEAISGFSGGEKKNPTYDQVSSGTTKYAESVQVIYDPSIISYSEILDILWKNIDPTDPGGSFHDRGSQYRSAIFYHSEEQKELAEMSKKRVEDLGVFDKPIVTQIVPFTGFYRAEEYHQDFYRKNPQRYYSYRSASGRDEFIKSVWGDYRERLQKFEKPDRETLKKTLTPLQFEVTQMEGTERAFNNLYWDNKKEGIYVDIVSGEPLFSSTDKFKSGTGWPSFTKPLEPKYLIEKEDQTLGVKRTEVRSRVADSHLGHVFNDGPPPTGLRYCLDSAALRFVPKESLEKEGYGEYLSLFSAK